MVKLIKKKKNHSRAAVGILVFVWTGKLVHFKAVRWLSVTRRTNSPWLPQSDKTAKYHCPESSAKCRSSTEKLSFTSGRDNKKCAARAADSRGSKTDRPSARPLGLASALEFHRYIIDTRSKFARASAVWPMLDHHYSHSPFPPGQLILHRRFGPFEVVNLFFYFLFSFFIYFFSIFFFHFSPLISRLTWVTISGRCHVPILWSVE